MSDTKTYPIYTVKPECLVDIPVSGYFYQRITGAYFTFISKFNAEESKEIMEAIAKKDLSTLSDSLRGDAETIQTLIMLMGTIEFKFKEKGDIKIENVEVPNEG